MSDAGIGLSPFARLASAHGFTASARLPLHGRCQAMRAVENPSGRAVALVALPAMDAATRDAVLHAWGEQTSWPLPCVLPVLGWLPAFDPDGPSLLVLDAPRGVPLLTRVGGGRPLPHKDARAVVDAVASALGHAHRRGRAHGLLARDRVWLAEESVQLFDVGLERALAAHGPAEEDPERSPVTGTPWAWAAPEVLEGRCDARSDVWSLALMAFWLRTGVDYFRIEDGIGPFLGELLRGPRWLASARARFLGCSEAHVPCGAFDAWFRGCVARDPDERFADITAAAAALPWTSTTSNA